jgi:glycosyltransferase involved in cell wall biosynthesis
MPVSILILTHNDEFDLPGCLQSVNWSDDVHVFDSFSSDQTLRIAATHGARVTQREFDCQASHMNAALDSVPFKYPWLLVLNADERVTAGLAAELKLMQYHTGCEVAYRIERREHVWGRRLKRNREESHHLRYFSWDSVRYVGEGLAVALVDGLIGTLEAPLDHFPLAKGVEAWLAKHNTRRTNLTPSAESRVLPDSIPWRAFWEFVKILVVKRAVLDGRAGISRACLGLIRDCTAHVKDQEARQGERQGESSRETSPPRASMG